MTEVTARTSIYDKPLINGKKQFYFTFDNGQYVVMKRFNTVPDKPWKTYKTLNGARNCVYHQNMH